MDLDGRSGARWLWAALAVLAAATVAPSTSIADGRPPDLPPPIKPPSDATPEPGVAPGSAPSVPDPPVRWPWALRRLARKPDGPLLRPPSAPPLVAAGPSNNVPPVAPEAPSTRTISLLFRLGVEYGGDEFASVVGPDGGSSKLIAGGLVAYDIGLLYQPSAPYAVEVTIGWKLEADRFDNGAVTLERFPLDIIASWSTGDLRAGVGVTLHIAPTIGCHVSGICDNDVSFDTAIGGIAQIAYAFYHRGTRGGDFAFRYTRISYSAGDGSMELDGSCFGLFIDGWY